MKQSDLYWLAGLLEGEGCFRGVTGDSKSGCYYPRVILKMTDLDVVERVAKLLGSKIHLDSMKPSENHKQSYVTTLTGTKAAGLIMTLYSLLGTRRKSKIRETLLKWKDAPGGKPYAFRDKCVNGHQYTSDNSYHLNGDFKYCKECNRKHSREYKRKVSNRKGEIS